MLEKLSYEALKHSGMGGAAEDTRGGYRLGYTRAVSDIAGRDGTVLFAKEFCQVVPSRSA
jgi:hypothetical protein